MQAFALVGKHPEQADFIRRRLDCSAQARCYGWLQRAAAECVAHGAQAPGARFMIALPQLRAAAVGVLAPSRDRVGRCSVLAAVAGIESAVWDACRPAIPAAYESVLADAQGLVEQGDAKSLDELGHAVAALRRPDASRVDATWRAQRAEHSTRSVRQFAQRVFGDRGEQMVYYACFALQRACAPRSMGPPRVLACPAPEPRDRAVWLEWVRRLRGSECMPSAVWDAQRMLVSTGPAPVELLRCMAGAPSDIDWLWPVQTGRERAIELARRKLGARLPPLDAPLERLFEAAELEPTG